MQIMDFANYIVVSPFKLRLIPNNFKHNMFVWDAKHLKDPSMIGSQALNVKRVAAIVQYQNVLCILLWYLFLEFFCTLEVMRLGVTCP